MGFKGREFHLQWPEGHDLHGLEVVCRPLTTGQLLDSWVRERDDSLEGQRETAMYNAKLLAGQIKRWNYEFEDSDEVRPISEETLLGVDFAVTTGIVGELVRQASGVPVPLPESSSNGESSEDMGLSEMMEYPSPSPPS